MPELELMRLPQHAVLSVERFYDTFTVKKNSMMRFFLEEAILPEQF